MPQTTLIERRRRISDRDKRQLSFVTTLSWAVITCSLILAILLGDYRRFENEFHREAIAIEHRLQSHIRQSEAVLEGFAAFLSGIEQLDELSTARYAAKIRQRFPNIFMMEVAEGVSAEGLPALEQRQRDKGYTGFEVKAFDYQGERNWLPLPDRHRYYPLIYLSPMPEESRPVLGLDIASHSFLKSPLLRTLDTGKYQTSIPFRLVEEKDAYVMFMPVDGPEDAATGSEVRFVVLIVLLSEQLLFDIKPLLNDATSVLIYHDNLPRSDSTGHLFRQQATVGLQPFQARHQVDLEHERHGFVLELQHRLRLSDISWAAVVAAALTGLLIYIYSRNFILKRYSRDIEWAKDEAKLQFLASYDALTELPNRRFLVSMLESRLQESGGRLILAMLFLDLDLFKQVNDTHGHRMGDVLLREVAQRIKRTLRQHDLAGRLGGDEFVVLLADYESRETVHRVVDKLRTEIESPYHVEGRSIRIRVSIGVALYPRDTDDLLDLLHLADKAMYKNKLARRKPPPAGDLVNLADSVRPR